MRSNVKQTDGATFHEETKKKSLFEGLSAAQVIAGALAAVTSMLLSSYIGIAGSIIGTAVGSIVATVASQIYKQALSASADKIRDGFGSISDTVHVRDIDIDKELSQEDNHGANSEAGANSLHDTDDRTRLMNNVPTSDNHMNEEELRAHAALERKRRINRRAIVIAVISALVAMLVSAAVVNAVTAGEGIGTKTDPILTVDDNGAWQFGHNSSYNVNEDTSADATHSDSATTNQTNDQPSTPQDTSNTTATDDTNSTTSTSEDTASSQGGNADQSGSSQAGDTSTNTGTSGSTNQSQDQGSSPSSDQSSSGTN